VTHFSAGERIAKAVVLSRTEGILASIVFVSAVLISGIHGYLIQAALSLALLLLFLLTGLQVSRFMFGYGTRSAILSFPISYILHSIAMSLCARVFGIHSVVMLIYIPASLLLFLLKPDTSGAVEQKPQEKYTFFLLIWLLVVILGIALPLAHIGSLTPQGYAYRAYFNADYFKHCGIAATLAHTGIPPANPYFGGKVLHYYWFFYVIPAYWITLFRSYPLPFLMVQFTIVGSLMFATTLYVAIRHLTTSSKTVLLALPLFLFGGSYEGIYTIHVLHLRNLSWSAFTTFNIDALTRWIWNTPQIDTLFRALLFAPQHLLALSVFLISQIIWKSRASLRVRALLYVLIFATFGFAVLIGAAFIAGSFLFLTHGIIRHPREKWREVLIAGALGLFFLFLYFPVLHMFQLDSGELRFGLVSVVFHTLPQYLLLNWGAILLLGLVGIVFHRPGFPVRFFLCFLGIALLSMNLVRESIPGSHLADSEVTLKLGYFATVALLILAAGFMDRLIHSRFGLKRTIVILLIFILPAVPTFLMDEYNCHDVRNSTFTTYVSTDDMEVMKWMKSNLPAGTVAQYVLEGENVRASVIPVFAEHTLFLGDEFHARAFQVPLEEYENRKNGLWSMFHQNSSARISLRAQQAGVQYLFLGSRDFTTSKIKYELDEPYFTLLAEKGGCSLYRVNEVTVDADLPADENFEILLRDSDGKVALRSDFDESFYPPEGNLRSGVGRWLIQDGTILLTSTRPLKGTLQFSAYALGRIRHVQFYLEDQLAGSAIINPKNLDVSLPMSLPAGQTRFRIHCIERAETADTYVKNRDQRLLSIRMRNIRFILE